MDPAETPFIPLYTKRAPLPTTETAPGITGTAWVDLKPHRDLRGNSPPMTRYDKVASFEVPVVFSEPHCIHRLLRGLSGKRTKDPNQGPDSLVPVDPLGSEAVGSAGPRTSSPTLRSPGRTGRSPSPGAEQNVLKRSWKAHPVTWGGIMV